MSATGRDDLGGATLSPEDFERLSAFIEARFGIHAGPAKRVLLETRLRKRLRALRMGSFEQYCAQVLSAGAGGELAEFVDAITTNKTDFFREPGHFDLLSRRLLPELAARRSPGEELRVWSAGCSTGEEPYTLAMVLADTLGDATRFRVVATDLSRRVLRHAAAGLYRDDQVQPVPLELRRRFLERSLENPDVVRVGPALRGRVTFRLLNLLDENYGHDRPFDAIFCRNVLIYFRRETQREVIARLCRTLARDGFLFLGHSESINGMDLPLAQIAPTVYTRSEAPGAPRSRVGT
jgi:chemotaxis protein methyltransferase CheR